MVLEVGYQHL